MTNGIGQIIIPKAIVYPINYFSGVYLVIIPNFRQFSLDKFGLRVQTSLAGPTNSIGQKLVITIVIKVWDIGFD